MDTYLAPHGDGDAIVKDINVSISAPALCPYRAPSSVVELSEIEM